MENLICDKCGKEMVWHDGTAWGPYGVDTENCRDPYFRCSCGNEKDAPQGNKE